MDKETYELIQALEKRVAKLEKGNKEKQKEDKEK